MPRTAGPRHPFKTDDFFARNPVFSRTEFLRHTEQHGLPASAAAERIKYALDSKRLKLVSKGKTKFRFVTVE